MAAIDLIVLGIIRQKPMSAYDIQKTVEDRNISKWVKISTPSITKKFCSLKKRSLPGLFEKAICRKYKEPAK